MTGLAAQVTAALERSVMPSVIARGAAIRVATAEAGVVTLEVTGSPGAVFPLASRIEAVIRAAVPEVTGVRLVAPGTGPSPSPPDAGGSLAEAAQQILDAEVNPAIAAHHGHVTVAGAAEGWIRIRLDGDGHVAVVGGDRRVDFGVQDLLGGLGEAAASVRR